MEWRGRIFEPPPAPPANTLVAKLRERTWIRRWIDAPTLDDDVVASVRRGPERAAGRMTLEPEPAPISDE